MSPAAKKKRVAPVKRGRGRPFDPDVTANPESYHVRYRDAEQRQQWTIAAATTGRTLQQWIRETLDAESTTAHHVPLLVRKST